MKDKTKYFVKEISSNYRKSSIDFFRLGIEEFHKIRKSDLPYFQTAVANLCIAIELLFKSIIAEKSIRDLYKDLPQDYKIYLSIPEIIPDAVSFRRISVDLSSSAFKTLEFNECVSLFYLFYPNDKQKYRPFLSLLSNIRNSSIHSFLPKFQLYDLSKVAYWCIDLFNFVLGEKEMLLRQDVKEANIKFVKEYDNERVERVRKAIEEAKNKTKKLNHTGAIVQVKSWNVISVTCPVCDSDALLYGSTETRFDGDDGSLGFFADSLECEECGLKLEDFDELKLAGIEIYYDRDESIYDYWRDFPPVPDMD